MTSRSTTLLCTTFALTAGLAVTPTVLQSQSYPKLLVSGRGLALTQLSVRQKSGSSWISTPGYVNGEEYRLTVRLTNFFPTAVSVGNPLASCHVSFMVRLRFDIHLAGAMFTSASSSSSVQYGQVSGAHTIWVDDALELHNTKSRTYYVYYKWVGPNVAIPVWPHKVGLGGGEVCLLPNMAPVQVQTSG
jgi:hypothetical protein